MIKNFGNIDSDTESAASSAEELEIDLGRSRRDVS